MLPRRNSLSRSASRKKPSVLRRANTVSSAAPTKSEMLGPDEKKRQAMAAAQRAFDDDADRRIRTSQASSTTTTTTITTTATTVRPRLSEINLNQLHLNRRQSIKCSAARGAATAAATTTTATTDDYDEDYEFPRPPPSPSYTHRQRFDDESTTEAEDYQSTVVRRRKSMQWYQENVTPHRPELDVPSDFSSPPPPPPQLGSSTPSSYRRIRRAKSAFTVSQIFSPENRDVSGVVYAAERSPQKHDNSRKSMSFLRGGTEFMGEGKSRERRSYYMDSSLRKGCPPIVSDAEKYKDKNERGEKGEWGAMRYSVKKKARKISESVFGSMRKVLGKACSDDKGPTNSISIPEQHITSSRMHFRDYVTPEEVYGENFSAPGKFGVKEKPKIRSNFVVSKAPTLHLVSSYEMIRSELGSIRDATPPVGGERKISGASIGTFASAASTNWNSTIASRMSVRRRENIPDKSRMSPVIDRDEGEYFQPPLRRERYNVDARRVYSALLKRIHDNPSLEEKRAPPQPSGYYMTPGIGLLPEEQGLFERYPITQTRKTSFVKRTMPSEIADTLEPYEYEAETPPPPVPKIPKMWLENENSIPLPEADGKYQQRVVGDNKNRYEPSGRVLSATAPAIQKQRSLSGNGSFADKTEMSGPIRGEEDSVSVDTFNASTDAALSACHLQMLHKRRSTPGTFASNENLRKRPSFSKRFSHLDAGEYIRRSRSVLDYHDTNFQVSMERTKASIGHDRPLAQSILFKAGLRNIDVNAPPIGGPDDGPFVTKRASRTSLSGRVSRMSMREFDVGLAVTRQFGPVIDQPVGDVKPCGRRSEIESDNADDPAFL